MAALLEQHRVGALHEDQVVRYGGLVRVPPREYEGGVASDLASRHSTAGTPHLVSEFKWYRSASLRCHKVWIQGRDAVPCQVLKVFGPRPEPWI